MTNAEFKEELIEALKERESYFKQRGDEFVIKCPFCGDNSNPRDGHFYIRINPNDNYKIVYNCFRCNESGILNQEVLELLGIDSLSLKSGIDTLNKTSDRMDIKNFYEEEKEFKSFDFTIPDIKKDKKTEYIENRLGREFTIEELEELKAVPYLYNFLYKNDIKSSMYPKNMLDFLNEYYVGFLSYGSSHLIMRYIGDREIKLSNWIKYPIVKESREVSCFYSISSSIDIYSKNKITINISEGVMDIISVNYNLGYGKENSISIAVTGRYYVKILLHLLSLGIVGNNVVLNIFADNDEVFNKKAKNPTTVSYFDKILFKIKHLYKEVNIFYNTIGKDFGVSKKEIVVTKIRL